VTHAQKPDQPVGLHTGIQLEFDLLLAELQHEAQLDQDHL
jgi:hypothetical protein